MISLSLTSDFFAIRLHWFGAVRHIGGNQASSRKSGGSSNINLPSGTGLAERGFHAQ
jgi:hypothetical protein